MDKVSKQQSRLPREHDTGKSRGKRAPRAVHQEQVPQDSSSDTLGMAALLSDARLAVPANRVHQPRILQRLQEAYGNARVEGIIRRAEARRKEESAGKARHEIDAVFRFKNDMAGYDGFKLCRSAALQTWLRGGYGKQAGIEQAVLDRLFWKIMDHFQVIDGMYGMAGQAKQGDTYEYRIQATLVAKGAAVHMVKLVSPQMQVRKGPAEAGAAAAGGQAAVEAGESLPEGARQSMQQLEDALGKLDDWVLRWGELAADDPTASRRLTYIRERVNGYHTLVETPLKTAEAAEKAARLAYSIGQMTGHEPGSQESAEAITKLARPAGELAKALAKFLPPGASQAAEALGEAMTMFPGFVQGIKAMLDPQERWRRRPREERGALIL